MDECSFSNEKVDISPNRTLQRAKCPLCGAIRTLHLRSYGLAFPVHKPLDADPMQRECWVFDGTEWRREK